MIDAGINLTMVARNSTLDSAPADINDPDQAEIDRLTASLDDLDDLSRSRSRGLVELVL
jgi:hypothetical protein